MSQDTTQPTAIMFAPVAREELDSLKQAHDKLVERVARMESQHGDYLDVHEERLDKHGERISTLERTLSGIQADVNRIASSVTATLLPLEATQRQILATLTSLVELVKARGA